MMITNKHDVEAMLDDIGFRCDYVPCIGKIARNWKQQVLNEKIDTSHVPDCQAYAVVPGNGMIILDCDRPTKAGGLSGIQIFRQLLFCSDGSFDITRYPEPFKVKTPSGGWHLYYSIPQCFQGHLKNMAHPNGLPIDVRCERKGYAVGAGSHTESGDYKAQINGPAPTLPLLPDQICMFLIKNGYTDIDMIPSCLPSPISHHQTNTKGMREVNMSPIPEGCRNNELYRWGFGRLSNHPENSLQIISDLYRRGHISGLSDSELTTIANSLLKGMGV